MHVVSITGTEVSAIWGIKKVLVENLMPQEALFGEEAKAAW
jgi:hypothetical protein